MRINDSALQHGITVEEINAVVAYPELQRTMIARRPGAQLVLAVGAYDVNEPYIEVIYDRAADEVFHAMMLRMALVRSAGIAEHIDLNRIAERQRR